MNAIWRQRTVKWDLTLTLGSYVSSEWCSSFQLIEGSEIIIAELILQYSQLWMGINYGEINSFLSMSHDRCVSKGAAISVFPCVDLDDDCVRLCLQAARMWNTETSELTVCSVLIRHANPLSLHTSTAYLIDPVARSISAARIPIVWLHLTFLSCSKYCFGRKLRFYSHELLRIQKIAKKSQIIYLQVTTVPNLALTLWWTQRGPVKENKYERHIP